MNPEDLRWQLPANSECTKNPDGYRMRSCFTIFAAERKDHGSLWSPLCTSGDSSCPYTELFWKELVWDHEDAVCWTTCQNENTGWPQDDSPDWFLCCVQAKIPLARDTFSISKILPVKAQEIQAMRCMWQCCDQEGDSGGERSTRHATASILRKCLFVCPFPKALGLCKGSEDRDVNRKSWLQGEQSRAWEMHTVGQRKPEVLVRNLCLL